MLPASFPYQSRVFPFSVREADSIRRSVPPAWDEDEHSVTALDTTGDCKQLPDRPCLNARATGSGREGPSAEPLQWPRRPVTAKTVAEGTGEGREPHRFQTPPRLLLWPRPTGNSRETPFAEAPQGRGASTVHHPRNMGEGDEGFRRMRVTSTARVEVDRLEPGPPASIVGRLERGRGPVELESAPRLLSPASFGGWWRRR